MSHAITKISLTTLAAFGLIAPAALAGVDPALLALVSPDAKMLIGIQVNQAQASPFGQYLLSQVQLDRNTNRVMIAAGFDPRRDLREILAASGDGWNGLLLGRGSFQPAKISKAAVLAGAASSTYRGNEVLTLSGTGKNKPAGSIAFLDASTVAAGDTDAVKAVIDRRAAGAIFSGQLSDRARQISSANDAWLATLTPPAALSSAAQNTQLGPFQNLIQSALQLSAGLKFAATQVTLSAEVVARSAQDAQSMADVLKFLAGMLQASRSQDPNAAKGPQLADAAQISSSGSVMHLVISVPEQQMEQLFVPDSKPPDSKQPASGQPKKIAAR
jgi:hypothetical protein